MSFKPRKSDIAWQQALFNSLSDNAIWITDNAVYRINKRDKTLLVLLITNAFSDPVENVSRVAKVCSKIGWKVIFNSNH